MPADIESLPTAAEIEWNNFTVIGEDALEIIQSLVNKIGFERNSRPFLVLSGRHGLPSFLLERCLQDGTIIVGGAESLASNPELLDCPNFAHVIRSASGKFRLRWRDQRLELPVSSGHVLSSAAHLILERGF